MAVADAGAVAVEKEVVYGRGGERNLLADVYRVPASITKRTAIVHLHGGGFTRGSKEGARTARPLAALGYTSVAAQYRVANEALWPAQIEDAKAAIRWTRAHAAELGVDPEKIAVLGHSAGGRLALLAAGTGDMVEIEGQGGNANASSSVAACVAFYPAAADADLVTGHTVLGPNPTEAALRTFNASNFARAEFPPTLLLHGTADATIPPEVSVEWYDNLSAAGVPTELHLIEGMTHIFDAHDDLAEASALWIDLFLERHVVNPRRYAPTEPAPR
jgi:acetyl esterase/lipase